MSTVVALSQFDWGIPASDTARMKPKRPRDTNQLAKMIVDLTTRETTEATACDDQRLANSRRGGLKGGKARAAALSSSERKEIAKKAAAARWNK